MICGNSFCQDQRVALVLALCFLLQDLISKVVADEALSYPSLILKYVDLRLVVVCSSITDCFKARDRDPPYSPYSPSRVEVIHQPNLYEELGLGCSFPFQPTSTRAGYSHPVFDDTECLSAKIGSRRTN